MLPNIFSSPPSGMAPHAILNQMLLGYRATRLLYTAAELGLADCLGEDAKTVVSDHLLPARYGR